MWNLIYENVTNLIRIENSKQQRKSIINGYKALRKMIV